MKQSLALSAAASPAYLTTNEVAARYRTVPSTVRYWRHTGYIPGGVKRGRRVLYSVAALDAWDAEQTEAGAA
ncbi:helix-turn-helix domain-containing protein [Streptomyces sp. NPDC086077]|uniref:helix-turn-helix domain-containing protein n=1 Tax=Streptomyces sp. NPDC086077 TaxID=3154862 RepID=UPI003449CE82